MDTKTPANAEAGTRDTRNARRKILKARIARIVLLPCFLCAVRQRLRDKRCCRWSAGTFCINAAAEIMLLAGYLRNYAANPTVLRLSAIDVDGYTTFAVKGCRDVTPVLVDKLGRRVENCRSLASASLRSG
jgi:hypothetical protein